MAYHRPSASLDRAFVPSLGKRTHSASCSPAQPSDSPSASCSSSDAGLSPGSKMQQRLASLALASSVVFDDDAMDYQHQVDGSEYDHSLPAMSGSTSMSSLASSAIVTPPHDQRALPSPLDWDSEELHLEKKARLQAGSSPLPFGEQVLKVNLVAGPKLEFCPASPRAPSPVKLSTFARGGRHRRTNSKNIAGLSITLPSQAPVSNTKDALVVAGEPAILSPYTPLEQMMVKPSAPPPLKADGPLPRRLFNSSSSFSSSSSSSNAACAAAPNLSVPPGFTSAPADPALATPFSGGPLSPYPFATSTASLGTAARQRMATLTGGGGCTTPGAAPSTSVRQVDPALNSPFHDGSFLSRIPSFLRGFPTEQEMADAGRESEPSGYFGDQRWR